MFMGMPAYTEKRVKEKEDGESSNDVLPGQTTKAII